MRKPVKIFKHLVADATLFLFYLQYFGFIQRCSYEYIRNKLFLVGVCVVDVLEVDWKLAFSRAELL
jgi:hypothetical protein